MMSSGRGTIYVASRFVADAGTALSPGAVAVENGVVVAAGGPDGVGGEGAAGFCLWGAARRGRTPPPKPRGPLPSRAAGAPGRHDDAVFHRHGPGG